MIDIRTNRQLQSNEHFAHFFRRRSLIAIVFVLLCFMLLLGRLLYLQTIRFNQYALQANENRISIIPITPSRGMITDRNGEVLARNYSAFTLEITLSETQQPLADLLEDLGRIIHIDAQDKHRFKRLQSEARRFDSLPIRNHLSDEEVARFSAQRFRFPGVAVQARLFRDYPFAASTAHAVGYIGRLASRDQDRLETLSEQNEISQNYDPKRDISNYRGTNFIGKTGIEQSYEYDLHGLTGYQQVETTAGGRPVRVLRRVNAEPGKDLVLSLDIGLQQAAEKALNNRRGAVVAIEPDTGEVLAFVSSPSFDPNLFVEGIDQQSWDALNLSPDHPMLNRPLRGTYPPASTYKPFMALAALSTNKRTKEWSFYDPGFFSLGGHRFRNVKKSGHGLVNMYRSIVVSNDTYYYMLAHELGVNTIHDFMLQFSFGQKTGIDIDGESRGVLPSTQWKERAFKQPALKRWYEGETVSLGIGQGYNAFTILQLAHATATIANHGIVYRPHLVKQLVDPITNARIINPIQASGKLNIKDSDINFVRQAMVGVMREGTGSQLFNGAPYQAAGKTGTAQVFSIRQNEKYRAHLVSERMRDHSLAIAYAPADQPKIALAIVVENAGWGASAAGPAAREIIDYYLIKHPALIAEKNKQLQAEQLQAEQLQAELQQAKRSQTLTAFDQSKPGANYLLTPNVLKQIENDTRQENKSIIYSISSPQNNILKFISHTKNSWLQNNGLNDMQNLSQPTMPKNDLNTTGLQLDSTGKSILKAFSN